MWHCGEDLAVWALAGPGVAAVTTAHQVNAHSGCPCRGLPVIDILFLRILQAVEALPADLPMFTVITVGKICKWC